MDCGVALPNKYNKKTAQAANAKLNCLGVAINAANASVAALQASTGDIAGMKGSVTTHGADIATLKSDVAALKGNNTGGLAADIAALKSSVNTLNAAVGALQGQPPATPPDLIFEDSFLRGKATGAARAVSNNLNSQSSRTAVSASFTVTNKTQQPLLLLAYYNSTRIIDDKAGGSCHSNPHVPYTTSHSGPLDPKDYFRLEPGGSIAVSLGCDIVLNSIVPADPSTLSFGITFYTYSANGPGTLAVSFSGVAAN